MRKHVQRNAAPYGLELPSLSLDLLNYIGHRDGQPKKKAAWMIASTS